MVEHHADIADQQAPRGEHLHTALVDTEETVLLHAQQSLEFIPEVRIETDIPVTFDPVHVEGKIADQLGDDRTPQLIVDYCSIQGWTGLFGGTGNNGDDPLFVDSLGPDGIAGTGDDDLRLGEGSPAINTSDPATLPELEAIDAAGFPRLQGCRVDRGAYESDVDQAFGDFDADNDLTLRDFAHFQQCFHLTLGDPDWPGVCRCVFDDNEDGDIDLDDFGAFYDSFVAR